MKAYPCVVGLCVLFWMAGAAPAQSPTPTPVDSNIAVSSFAQGRGTPCTSAGGDGCGGCYPDGLITPSDAFAAAEAQLTRVNSEWQPIGPMIEIAPGVGLDDPLVPPASRPVTVTGTVALSKINETGDFPSSHLSDDQNTFINLDPAVSGLLGTGNTPPGCTGEGCHQVEMEWEINKYPLFAWAGEGDRINAVGRWIFDCGHPDAEPAGGCTGNGSVECTIDGDCVGTCSSGQCSNDNTTTCSANSACNFGTCTNPVPNFNYRAELHPPQAVAVIRDKSIGKTHAARADVYISADGGGAGDACTVTHLQNPLAVLTSKHCFLNHCSVTTGRSCQVDKDCASNETCVRLDPAGRVANVNASNFTFDMPLPPPPPGASTIKDLKISSKSFKQKGGLMPKATLSLVLSPTPALHVVVPMATPLPNGLMPNLFARRISAGWKKDTTPLTHVQVKFTGLSINHPVKPNTPAFERQCFNTVSGPTNTTCTTDQNCPVLDTCNSAGTPCRNNAECLPTDFCNSQTHCIGGVLPGWRLFAEVNGDWIQFANLATVGAAPPFATLPYTVPSPAPTPLKQNFKFDEYLPAGGTIHIATTGQSLNCLDLIYGTNLIDDLNEFSIDAAAGCLESIQNRVGTIDVTHSGSNFATVSGATCTASGSVLTCAATSSNSDGGICSASSQLCLTDADCPSGQTCNVTGGAFTLHYTLQVK